MPLGFYENFPSSIHLTETFKSSIPSGDLQERLMQVLQQINRKEFSFEEVSNPTIPDCKVIFEFGLAEGKIFCYIDEDETKKALRSWSKETTQIIDFFCAIRYYKGPKKNPLKFDYYLLRTMYNENILQVQISAQRGPRYISPQDLTTLLSDKTNEATNKKILERIKE